VTQPPELVHTRAELDTALAARGGRVGVVMTMGALHDGHRELIRVARGRCEVILVTVFLNPLQFGPSEDLSRYPQTLSSDLELCSAEQVDIVFAPSVQEMYPEGTQPQVRVSAGPLGDVLEGASRPGHFDGVLTVVAKLLHITRPDFAYFGQKDAQQLLLIRRMVADLDFPCQVVAVPTVREPAGLALSSRNGYLSAQDREVALTLSRALRAGGDASAAGPEAVRRAAAEVLDAQPRVAVDYLVLVDPVTLVDVPEDFSGGALLAVAARVGGTRLIDNVTFELGDG
jgi:pantoate--beta-alanine ligase